MNLFITGAGRGLGRHLAARAAAAGHTVLAGIRSASSGRSGLDDLLRQHPGRILPVEVDVADEASVESAAHAVRDAVGKLDAIVNNAAILAGRNVPLERLDMAEMERSMQVNLYGPMRVAKHFVPLLTGAGPRTVLNVSSDAGGYASAYDGDYPYAISKAALNFFSAQLQRGLAVNDVAVYAVHPGWIRTDMGGAAAPGDPVESAEGLLALLERRVVPEAGSVFVDFRGRQMR